MSETRGFLDRAKAAMGQAAEKAKEELEELQHRRDLGQAERELGKLAFELVEAGELEHPALEEKAAKVRELRALVEGAAAADAAAEPEPEPTEPAAPEPEP